MKSNRRNLMTAGHFAWIPAALAVIGLAAIPVSADTALKEVASRSEGGVTYTATADGIIIAFAEQRADTVPVFTRAAVAADDDAFRGNLAAAGMETVAFRIMSDGDPLSQARVVLEGLKSGRRWSRPFEIAGAAGDWQNFAVALSRADGWERRGSDLDAKFAADLADVAWIGLEIQRGGRAAQSYTIAGFVLSGKGGVTPDAPLSPLQLALRARFGVTSLDELSAEQRLADSRGDGMSDWERILAEHDDDFANAIFKVRIARIDDDGVTIAWPAVEGSTYTVFRSQQLTEGFNLLPGGLGVDIPADVTGMLDFTDPSARPGVSYYYRVMRK